MFLCGVIYYGFSVEDHLICMVLPLLLIRCQPFALILWALRFNTFGKFWRFLKICRSWSLGIFRRIWIFVELYRFQRLKKFVDIEDLGNLGDVGYLEYPGYSGGWGSLVDLGNLKVFGYLAKKKVWMIWKYLWKGNN